MLNVHMCVYVFRLQKLWEQEVSEVGLQKASLTRVLLRLQGNRLLLALIISVFFVLALFVGSVSLITVSLITHVTGPPRDILSSRDLLTVLSMSSQGVLVHEILSYVVHPEMSSVLGGVALCAAVVSVEIFRVVCLGLSWALNLRTGIRLKAGFCMLGFNKILSLRTLSGSSVGQVRLYTSLYFCVCSCLYVSVCCCLSVSVFLFLLV